MRQRQFVSALLGLAALLSAEANAGTYDLFTGMRFELRLKEPVSTTSLALSEKDSAWQTSLLDGLGVAGDPDFKVMTFVSVGDVLFVNDVETVGAFRNLDNPSEILVHPDRSFLIRLEDESIVSLWGGGATGHLHPSGQAVTVVSPSSRLTGVPVEFFPRYPTFREDKVLWW